MDPIHGSSQRRYRAYGLRITSSLHLPELEETSEAPSPLDAIFSYGDFPEILAGATSIGLRYQAAQNKLILKVDNVASYEISNGNRILVNPAPEAEKAAIRLFLLGPALRALFHQRNTLVLRGSAIEADGQAIAFLGPTGVGKSTLIMAMTQRGHRPISDDLCVIRAMDDGSRIVEPGCAHILLWPNALRHLNFSPHIFNPVRIGVGKRTVPIQLGPTRPKQLSRIYLIQSALQEDIQIKLLDGKAAHSAIESNEIAAPFLQGMGAKAAYSQMAMALVQRVPFRIALIPRRKFQPLELAAAIECDLNL